MTIQRKPPASPPPSAGERYITRTEAADLLGVSMNTILNHERRGKLTAHWTVLENSIGQMRNTPLLKVDEVVKLPRRAPRPVPEDPHELCARAFELFEEGKTPKQAVIELRASYQTIVAIHGEWLDAGSAALVMDEASKRALVELVGGFESTNELVELVKKKLAP